MVRWDVRAGRAVLGAGLLLLAGCVGAEHEPITVTNRAAGPVTVQLGTEELRDVTQDGGAVLLEPPGCYDGPIIVTYSDGRTTELAQAICPGQELWVRDDGAEVRGEPVS